MLAIIFGSLHQSKDFKEPGSLQITMLLQSMGKENKETQIRFKMQKDGEPVWDQVTIDRLWVTTQREAMIEAGPPSAGIHTDSSSAQEQEVQKE